MTVIVSIISKTCCAHASDSFITTHDGSIINAEDTKIFPVYRFKGVLAFWETALFNSINGKQQIYSKDLIKELINSAKNFQNPRDFAFSVRDFFNKFYIDHRITNAPLGFHFSAYEVIEGINIPELFTIRNFKGVDYHNLLPYGFEVLRNTYCILPTEYKLKGIENDNESNYCRIAVQRYLDSGKLITFNNGDPELSSIAIASLFEMSKIASSRRIIKYIDHPSTYRQMATWIVDSVSDFQKKLLKKKKQIVGGKRHNISITPNGVFDSDTGDK